MQFFPASRQTGAALRNSLNKGMSDSLAHVFEACAGHVEVPAEPAEALVSRLRAGSRETPYLYSLYFGTLEAIEADDLDAVEDLIGRLVRLAPAAPGTTVTTLDPDEFPWDAGLIAGYFADEEDSFCRYGPPDRAEAAESRAQLAKTLERLRDCAPDLAAEFEEIVPAIILAGGIPLTDEPGAQFVFQGVSALRAFGAILLDATPAASWVDRATTLIHEEAHNVLFAYAPKEGVVRNPDDERYASPLRSDPRPLEGIFHATFVLARMVHGLEIMRNSGNLSAADRTLADETIAESRPLYFDGLETLRKHADLTPEGAEALRQSEAFMGTP